MADASRRRIRAADVRTWTLLLATSLLVTLLLRALAVPASLLLGPMLAGVAVTAHGHQARVPAWMAVAGQAVVGCLIASSMAGALGPTVTAHWQMFALLAAVILMASCASGYALNKLGVVPGPVAVWGSMPGGAAAMVLLAETAGADARLVAVMVYTRVVVVTLSATALAAALGDAEAVPTVAAAIAPDAIWAVLAVAAAGVAAAMLLRWRAGTLLLTMAIGIAGEAAGLPRLIVPAPLLTFAFAAIGWRIGLSFTADARGAAAMMLPRVALAALLLAAFCGLLALGLHLVLGVDLLTAWLATSPGGLESVAAIAGSLPVDGAFVMAAQTARFGLVMLAGPPLAKALTRRIAPAAREAPR